MIGRAVLIMKDKDIADDMKLRERLYAGAHELTKTLAHLRQRKYSSLDPRAHLRELRIRLLSGANAFERGRDGSLVLLDGLFLQLDVCILI